MPAGSTVRLQQMLSILGYLPLRFNYAGIAGVAPDAAGPGGRAVEARRGQLLAGATPTPPSALIGFWQPGTYGTVTKGALMAFENDQRA